MMKTLEKTLKSVSENPKYIFQLTIQGMMVGVFAGLMVCLYRFLLAGSEHILRNYLNIIHGNVLYIILFFIYDFNGNSFIEKTVKTNVTTNCAMIVPIAAPTAPYLGIKIEFIIKFENSKTNNKIYDIIKQNL